MKVEIAILMTCFNRVDKTLQCLERLHNSVFKSFDVFLVDDSSTDNTVNSVTHQYPYVKVINGSGDLFWNQGMRLAWKTALNTKKYDFLILLNDDTYLYENSISQLLDCYFEAKNYKNKESIIVGSCHESKEKRNFSYGGRNENGAIIPNGMLQECKYINGNCVLISKHIYEKLGNLEKKYSHAFGDIDYGLRAIERGFGLFISKDYVAFCEPNKKISPHFDPKNSLITRFRCLNSKKGLIISEYFYFRKRFWGWKWIYFLILLFLKVISPKIYFYFKNLKHNLN